jgi:hypothetical protein
MHPDQAAAFSSRLDRLERQNRRLRLAIAFLACLFVSVAILLPHSVTAREAVQQNVEVKSLLAKTISAELVQIQGLIVVDKNGKRVAGLVAGDDGPSLSLGEDGIKDSSALTRRGLSVHGPEKAMFAQVGFLPDGPGASISVSSNVGMTMIASGKTGPGIVFAPSPFGTGKLGKSQITPDGIALQDTNGKLRVQILTNKPDLGPSFKLFDSIGKAIYEQP